MNIYPDFKVVMRFATIMSILLTVAMALVCPLLTYIIAIFFVSFFTVLLFSYSFRISITNESIRVYQYFIPVSNILIEDIDDAYYAPWANNGQGSALVILLKRNEEKIFPVRLYGEAQINNIISILTKNRERRNKHEI